MSDFCFSFLEYQYRDIYLDCARMDKNLIEGDGVEAILIAGRIAEKITKAIFDYEGFRDDDESQFKRLERLNNANILPNNINNDFRELRRLRNDVYHNTYTSKTISSMDKRGTDYSKYSKINKTTSSSGLRDYKTGLSVEKPENKFTKPNKRTKTPNHIKFSKSKKHNSRYVHENKSKMDDLHYGKSDSDSSSSSMDFTAELVAAREAHKLVFNICVWFYVNYSGDKDFIRPEYKLNKRSQDSDFLLRLKSAINEGNGFVLLQKSNPDNEIINILSELYIPKEAEKEDDDLVYGINNKNFKIRQPNGPYSKEIGISYDDNIFMWEARHSGKNLGYFESSKEAFEAREIYIHSLPIPPKHDGKYSKHNGISFSKIQKLWTASVKGQLIAYYANEKAAVKGREKYLKKHSLIDVKVDGGYKTVSLKEAARYKSNSQKDSLKSVSKKDSSGFVSKKESSKSYSKKKEKVSSFRKEKRSDASFALKKSKDSNPSSGKKGSIKNAKKVKVSSGNRVSAKKSKKTASMSKRKSSKYEGVYYEEGLFVWSAEVDGKHLGLFSSEEEANKKREEYLKQIK